MAIDEEIQHKLESIESDFFPDLEVALKLKISPRTLDRWYRTGKGPPATLISNRRYYNKKTFLQWLNDREQRPATQPSVQRQRAASR
jgi:hypothetical protein